MLGCFKYYKKQDVYGVLPLFEEVIESNYKTECSLEVIKAAKEGRINFDCFSLRRYEAKTKANQHLAEEERGYRELGYDELADPDAEEGSVSITAESLQSIAPNTVSPFDAPDERLLDNAELEDAFQYIAKVENNLMLRENVNIRQLVASAMNTVGESIDKLKELCSADVKLGDALMLIIRRRAWKRLCMA